MEDGHGEDQHGPDRMESHLSEPPVMKLYAIKQARRREVWNFVRLYAKPEFTKLASSQLTSDHAAGAYCLICCTTIYYSKGLTSAVRDHMVANHGENMKEFLAQYHPAPTDSTSIKPKSKRAKLSLSTEEQALADRLLAGWLAQSHRPISLVEDPGFRAYMNYVVGTLTGIHLVIPKRTQMGREIAKLAGDMRTELQKKLSTDCLRYSITTDIWTDRSQRSYMALTLHYVDPQFELRNWTLEVEHCPGMHSGEAIADVLEAALNRWGLDKDKCTMMLRDGASNAVSAGNNLEVMHMSCVAHMLHLVVGGAMIKKKGDTCAYKVQDEVVLPVTTNDLELEHLRDVMCEQVDEFVSTVPSVTEKRALADMRRIVRGFRDIATFFHRSPKGKHRLLQIQRKISKNEPIGTITDCPTRWGSCRDMLQRLVDLQPALNYFYRYLQSTLGRNEFPGVTMKSPSIEDWLAIRCLLGLLVPFTAAIETLGGQKYPTMTMTIPWLRLVERELRDEAIFSHLVASVEGQHSVTTTMATMHSVRDAFVRLFSLRFKDLSVDLTWITYLDPRFARMQHLLPDEVEDARKHLLWAATDAALSADIGMTSIVSSPLLISPEPTPQKVKARMAAYLRGSWPTDDTTTSVREDSPDATLLCEREIAAYLSRVTAKPFDGDPLKWWHGHHVDFPILANLARKWLGCVATSVPSERAFSTGGNVVTVKRCRLSPDTVRDHVFLAENTELMREFLSF